MADALGRLSQEESEAIFSGSVRDLVKARLVADEVFSMDGSELHATEHYPGAGAVTTTRETTDKWGHAKAVTSTRYGYLLLSLRGVLSNTVAAATVEEVGASEHSYVLELVRDAKVAGTKIRVLVIDGAYCVGDTLWRLKHEERADFIVPADTTMCITQDARGLALLGEGP